MIGVYRYWVKGYGTRNDLAHNFLAPIVLFTIILHSDVFTFSVSLIEELLISLKASKRDLLHK
jgi:hypothetical protein